MVNFNEEAGSQFSKILSSHFKQLPTLESWPSSDFINKEVFDQLLSRSVTMLRKYIGYTNEQLNSIKKLFRGTEKTWIERIQKINPQIRGLVNKVLEAIPIDQIDIIQTQPCQNESVRALMALTLLQTMGMSLYTSMDFADIMDIDMSGNQPAPYYKPIVTSHPYTAIPKIARERYEKLARNTNMTVLIQVEPAVILNNITPAGNTLPRLLTFDSNPTSMSNLLQICIYPRQTIPSKVDGVRIMKPIINSQSLK